MRRSRRRTLRVLAIDPTSRGFGFVVLEGPRWLVDWGVKDIRENKQARTLAKVEELIRLYRPEVLVAEECDDPSSRRSPRIASLLAKVFDAAASMKVRAVPVSVAKVRGVFAVRGARTKHEVTTAIVAHFPELASYRPQRRKAWTSEDERQAIFDAAALALTSRFRSTRRMGQPRAQLRMRAQAARGGQIPWTGVAEPCKDAIMDPMKRPKYQKVAGLDGFCRPSEGAPAGTNG